MLEACSNMKLDIMIVGNRGLGTLKRAMLGSVSSYLVQNSTCPIIVVRQPVVIADIIATDGAGVIAGRDVKPPIKGA